MLGGQLEVVTQLEADVPRAGLGSLLGDPSLEQSPSECLATQDTLAVEFAPLDELHLYAPTLWIGEQRWALRSDRSGADLSFEALDGVGQVTLALPEPPEGIRREVAGLNVLLVGRDGSAVGVRSLGQALEVPAGDYRVGMVTLRLRGAGGPVWSFVFSEPGGSRELTWHTVEKDQVTTIDPVGVPSFRVGGPQEQVAPGAKLDATPMLLTQDGLMINTAYRGKLTSSMYGGMEAELQLRGDQGVVLSTANSGFN